MRSIASIYIIYICTQSYKAKFTNITTYGRSNKYVLRCDWVGSQVNASLYFDRALHTDLS